MQTPAPQLVPRYAVLKSPFGDVVRVGSVQPTGMAVSQLYFGTTPPADCLPCTPNQQAIYQQHLDAYFSTPHNPLPWIIHTKGTPFQRQVWAALCTIPYGCTVSYGAIALMLNRPKAARAVANACAANVVALCIPCHRVVQTNGALGGYRWGADLKADLLRHEGMNMLSQC